MAAGSAPTFHLIPLSPSLLFSSSPLDSKSFAGFIVLNHFAEAERGRQEGVLG